MNQLLSRRQLWKAAKAMSRSDIEHDSDLEHAAPIEAHQFNSLACHH